jgi:hypothetical protein
MDADEVIVLVCNALGIDLEALDTDTDGERFAMLRDLCREKAERIAALEAERERGAALHSFPVTGEEARLLIREQREMEARIAALEAALEALGGSPKDMLDFCQAHGLEVMKPEPVADTWRKSIARFALARD